MPQGEETPSTPGLRGVNRKLSALERKLSKTQDPAERDLILTDINTFQGIRQRQIHEAKRRAARSQSPEQAQRDSTLQERVRARRAAETAAGLERGKP